MSRLPTHLGTSARAAWTSVALLLACGTMACAQTPTGAQPTLPAPSKAASPVVDTIAAPAPLRIDVRKAAARHAAQAAHRHVARYHHHGRPIDVDRPALAGVLLVEPIPPRIAPPRPMVPTPAYFVDGIASAFTTPAPAVVCEHRPRDRTLPDPRLYREVPVECGYDID
jgi:hypothetical protein